MSKREKLIKSAEEKMHFRERLQKDPDIYSTVETVFDHKTRTVLFKYIRKGMITEVQGVMSTGKEANVYFCPGAPALACKIYRIDSPSFRKMKRYVIGDYRFTRFRKSRVGFIQAWAKKEFKNLKKMQKAGISAPTPIKVDRNVLFLEFLGEQTIPFPKLINSDVKHPASLYKDILSSVKLMYEEAKIVHGDLSPYNILYNASQCKFYIIDVSQSVLSTHPEAPYFLLRDIYNINKFFVSLYISTLPVEKLFEWITGNQPKEVSVAELTK